MDSYLEIARKVLREARQPLTARQILKAAYQLQIVPRNLYGRTQHKTLHARLATDILKRRLQSDFYRTGPGRFFLRALKGDRSISAKYRSEYLAPLRAVQLGRFDVIAFQRSELRQLTSLYGEKLFVRNLVRLRWHYRRMDDVRRDPDMLAFRFFVVLVCNSRILLSHRGLTPEGELASRTTIGFDGIVKREDKSLFSDDEVGLIDAVIRTLGECIKLPPRALCRLEETARLSTAFVLFEEEATTPATDDLIVVVSVDCSGVTEVIEATEATATMEWQQLPLRANDLDRFDRWSAKIVSDPSLQMVIAN